MKTQKIARVTATPLNVPLHVTLAGADRQHLARLRACRGRDRRRHHRPRLHGDHRGGRDRADRQRRRGTGDRRRRRAGARGDLGEALLEDRCRAGRPVTRRMRSRRSTWRCGTSRARRWDSRCGGCSAARATRVPVYATFGFGFFDREQLARRGEALGRAGLQPAEDDGRQRGAAPARPARRLHDVIREDAARVARGARGGRARRSSCSSTRTAISTSITRRSSPR